MLLGLACCTPLLLGLSLALGVYLVAAPVVMLCLLCWTLREVMRQYHLARQSNA
jgi:hypothetical protein